MIQTPKKGTEIAFAQLQKKSHHRFFISHTHSQNRPSSLISTFIQLFLQRKRTKHKKQKKYISSSSSSSLLYDKALHFTGKVLVISPSSFWESLLYWYEYKEEKEGSCCLFFLYDTTSIFWFGQEESLVTRLKQQQLCWCGNCSLVCWERLIFSGPFFSMPSLKRRGSNSSPWIHPSLFALVYTLHYRMEYHLCNIDKRTRYRLKISTQISKTEKLNQRNIKTENSWWPSSSITTKS